MKLNDQHYELVSVHDLTPHPKNPNRGNAEAIEESIAENGFFGAIVAQKSSGHILIGHHRLQAAIGQGAEQVPVLWLDVDDRRALRVLLADNRTAELAHRDTEALAELLSELNLDGGITGTGYTDDDLDKLVSELAEADTTSEMGKDESARLRDSFGIVITCESELHQVQLLERFQQEGLSCRALIS